MGTPADAYCAAFGKSGEEITATLSSSLLSVETAASQKVVKKLGFALSDAKVSRTNDPRLSTCKVVVSSANTLAAIGFPVLAQSGDSSSRCLLVLVFDYQQNSWANHYTVPMRSRDAASELAGFLSESKQLIILTNGSGSTSSGLLVQEIDTAAPSTSIKESIRELPYSSYVYPDTLDNRIWLAAMSVNKKMNWPKLQCLSLIGQDDTCPRENIATLRDIHRVPHWKMPRAFAFPAPDKLVFAETGWSLGFSPSHLWVVDFAARSIKALSLPKDKIAALKHGIGLTWIEDITDPFSAMSPDGQFVVVPISLTTTGPPYIVDNYIEKGARLVIVDLQKLRILASVKPPNNSIPSAFALYHHDGKVLLLVNWNGQWKREEFQVQ